MSDTYLGPITDSYSLLEKSWPDRIRQEVEDLGWAAEIYDAEWRLKWVSPELRFILGNPTEVELGFSEVITRVYQMPIWADKVTPESYQKALEETLGYILYQNESADEVRASLPEELVELLEKVEPREAPGMWSVQLDFLQNDLPPNKVSCLNIQFEEEGKKGTLRLYGPAMKASVLSLVARGSEDMYERMSKLITPGRRPAAILFCDIERSTDLARRLPSAVYFQLLSALAKKIDDIIVSYNGVVGKHAGDGASAYFLPQNHVDTSSVVRAAIVSAREIRDATKRIAAQIGEEAGMGPIDLNIKCALHWGSTVYIGQIVSGGRLEVSALGDEVNECARLESAASGGTILASKVFLERLDSEDAGDLAIPVDSLLYQPLGEIEGVGGKSLRDTGNIPVCLIN